MERSLALRVPNKVAQYARSSLLTLALVLAGLGFGSASVSSAVAATPLLGCSASEMYVVAHEDDSLLFQSPALLQGIQSGHCVRSVFVTAGDAGEGQSYWGARERGAEAAYAQMAGVADEWSESTIVANGHPIVLKTLSGAPAVSLAFMRLPDGFPSGQGSPLFGGQSLERLWGSGNPSGSLVPPISSITAVDGSASYGYQNLIDTLGSLIASFEPQRIATQNFQGFFHGPNHDDHVAAAYFTQAAQKSYVAFHQLIGYEDYESSDRPANLSGSLLAQKSSAFYVYGEHDSHACGSSDGCSGTAYATWLARQYVAAVETTGLVAVAGYSQTVAGGETVNLDGSASSAESEKPLTYKWAQTAGPAVTLSSTTAAKPTFTAPAGPAALTFSLVVSNGSQSSTPASVEVKVAAPSTPSSTNVAPLAAATASSQASGQGAKEAIDGIIGGYPKDSSAEWSTVSGKVNSTLTLKWTASYTLDRVVLYDRPNSDDQITAGKLTFSDGQSVSFGSLSNAGTPGLSVSFPAHATTSLTMTVTGVAATTRNVGLAEIEAFGVAGEAPANLAPSITSASSTSFTSGTQKSFTVIAAGNPAPALTEAGTLPSGLSFQDNGNGTASLSGTAKAVGAPGSSQGYPLTFTATNPAGTATQQFTLTVVNGETPPAETPPTANAGSAQSVASAASVALDGSASSDPNKLPLTYKWAQTAGPAVTLSSTTAAKPTFTAPAGPAALTFSLVVSNGSQSSTPASVEVKVAAPSTPSSTNVAPLAAATASSQASGQGAKEAIDGIIGGYPKDSSAEWSTVSGKVNSTLTLKWTASYTLDRVVLYDRPNSDDQITAGKLTFSDGQSVSFGSLSNAGTPGLSVSFPAHATTSLTMTVTGVAATTRNVGLAEIEAFGVAGEAPANLAPSITSASSTSFTSGTQKSFTVIAAGNPAPALTEAGTLPSGLSFQDNGNGTASLSGTAKAVGAPGSSQGYPLTFTATNPAGTATQQFTLTVVNGETPPAETPPTANAGSAQSVASAASVALDGSASSDPNKLPLTYKWAQTAGPAVTLSSTTAAKPTFTAPAGPAALTFSLVVSNGSQSSTPASVEVKVAAPSTPSSTNVAPLAAATASSQASGQGAKEAIDGIIGGYPKDSSAEWSTVSGKVNSTLTLKWTASYTLDRVVLYDRPNSDDQITAGKLTFSDGQSVSFGSLSNAGTPGLSVSFPAHATTSLTMTVTGVAATTRNVGLAEIEAFGVAG